MDVYSEIEERNYYVFLNSLSGCAHSGQHGERERESVCELAKELER